jgi:hypothetical protein
MSFWKKASFWKMIGRAGLAITGMAIKNPTNKGKFESWKGVGEILLEPDDAPIQAPTPRKPRVKKKA